MPHRAVRDWARALVGHRLFLPVFLTTDAVDAWLSPVPLDTPQRVDETLDLLRAASDDVAATIDSYRVDRKVNNTRTVDPHDPSLIRPIDE